jgi:REP element-mobilizing transposase RayT
MSRKPRYVPPGGCLVEVTCRTVHGRLLLRPSREVNETIVGVLGRALERYPLELIAAVFMSNHFHLLVRVDDAQSLAHFMRYLNGNLSREIGRLHGWPQTLWGRRYDAILVSEEEKAQVSRLRYLLAHGVKEGLVRRSKDWPGVHCAESLLTGRRLEGCWFDRTREYQARRRGRRFNRYTFAEEMGVEFGKLPCWSHLSESQYRSRIGEIVEQIEREANAAPTERGARLPSAATCRKRIRRQHPHTRVLGEGTRRPAPAVHAHRKRAREKLLRAIADFVAAYRVAARRLREGDRRARFPTGCFPPHLPFVAAARAP